MTIPARRLKLYPDVWPNTVMVRIVKKLRPASVLKASRSTELFEILEAEARAFKVRHRIRQHAAKDLSTFYLILSLLAYSEREPICSDPADRFEARLMIRDLASLRDLLGLLDMPGSPLSTPALQLPEAA